MRLWHRLSRDGRDVPRSWTISLIKTLSFCIIDLAWAEIGGSFWVRVCVCAKAWKHILLCINMRSIKNAQFGMVWKEIYLKVMVHSCTSFGVWPWQIVVVELVIARKHTRATHTHTLINIYINISALQMCAHFLHTNTSKHWVNKVHLYMYINCTYKHIYKHSVCCSAVMLFGCSALQ